MKKTILTSVLSSIFFLFLANVAVAQIESTPADGIIVDFVPVKNQTKLPAEVAKKLHAEIKKHVSTWNRVSVVVDIPHKMPMKSKTNKATESEGSKPGPTKSPSGDPTIIKQNPNTIATVNITSFKTGSGRAPASDALTSSKQKAGIRALISGEVTFRAKGGDKILAKVPFKGDYVTANEVGAAPQKASAFDDGTTGSAGAAGTSKALKQKVMQRACKRAFNDFKKNGKYAFTSDLEIIRVLEEKAGSLLTIEMNGGNMQDVNNGYQYDLYVMQETAPKQFTESIIGNVVVLQTGGTKSVAKIMNGNNFVLKYLNGENKKTVFARLTETTESVKADPIK